MGDNQLAGGRTGEARLTSSRMAKTSGYDPSHQRLPNVREKKLDMCIMDSGEGESQRNHWR